MLAVAKAAFYFGLAYMVYSQARKAGTWSWPIFGRVMLVIAGITTGIIVVVFGLMTGGFSEANPILTTLLLLSLITLAALVLRRRSRRLVAQQG